MDYKQASKEIIPLIGGIENVSSFTNCMTRLRINVKDTSKVKVDEIKKIKGVMGVVPGEQTQIIVGPGHAQRIRDAFGEVSGLSGVAAVQDDDIEKKTKDAIKAKQNSPIQAAFRHLGNIFVPIIPGFVGCGIILAIMNVIRAFVYHGEAFTNPWLALFLHMGLVLSTILHIIVGYNASKEFGGNPVLGAIAGGIIYLPAMNGFPDQKLVVPILNTNLSSQLGGVLGVILAAFIFTKLEKWFRKVVPASLDLFLVPFFTIVAGTAITIIAIMPIASIIMNAVTYLLVDIALKQGGIIGGFFLSALFLPLVMLGIHQGLTPVHADLIEKTAAASATGVGYTVLLPILATAGAGQVGMALAVLAKTKDPELKTRIKNALPVGFLGVGEPLIYGVSLPLFYPFITACIGAGFGGAVIAFATQNVGEVGAIAMGPSGLVLLPLIANGMWLWYLLGLLASYAAGFVLTYFFGYNESMLERLK